MNNEQLTMNNEQLEILKGHETDETFRYHNDIRVRFIQRSPKRY